MPLGIVIHIMNMNGFDSLKHSHVTVLTVCEVPNVTFINSIIQWIAAVRGKAISLSLYVLTLSQCDFQNVLSVNVLA